MAAVNKRAHANHAFAGVLAPICDVTVSFRLAAVSLAKRQFANSAFGGTRSMKNLRQLLWRLPALLGAGALLTYGARATVSGGSNEEFGSASAARANAGEVMLKLENDNIFFSQDAGRTFEELELAATPQAARLKQLLRKAGASGRDNVTKVAPTIVADGAGGLQWARPKPVGGTDSTGAAQQVAVPAAPATVGKARPAVAGPRDTVRTKGE
jgi:hypothetical protein